MTFATGPSLNLSPSRVHCSYLIKSVPQEKELLDAWSQCLFTCLSVCLSVCVSICLPFDLSALEFVLLCPRSHNFVQLLLYSIIFLIPHFLLYYPEIPG